jgi:hypothetical protein
MNPPQPPGGYGPQPPWAGGPTVMAPVVHPLAIVALVGGLIQCIPGSGVAAMVCGFMARSAIRREPYRYTGETLALVGIVLGAIHIALGLFYVVGVLALGVLGAVAH